MGNKQTTLKVYELITHCWSARRIGGSDSDADGFMCSAGMATTGERMSKAVHKASSLFCIACSGEACDIVEVKLCN